MLELVGFCSEPAQPYDVGDDVSGDDVGDDVGNDVGGDDVGDDVGGDDGGHGNVTVGRDSSIVPTVRDDRNTILG